MVFSIHFLHEIFQIFMKINSNLPRLASICSRLVQKQCKFALYCLHKSSEEASCGQRADSVCSWSQGNLLKKSCVHRPQNTTSKSTKYTAQFKILAHLGKANFVGRTKSAPICFKYNIFFIQYNTYAQNHAHLPHPYELLRRLGRQILKINKVIIGASKVLLRLL